MTGAVESPLWTDDDRALMVALDIFEESLCRGCGQPIAKAWHAEYDGWFEAEKVVCHACTAQRGEEIFHSLLSLSPKLTPEREATFPPFAFGKTTIGPSPAPSGD